MFRLKAERLKRGWSQTIVAYRAPIGIGELSLIERGRLIPSDKQRKRLAKVLQLDEGALLDDVPEPTRSVA